MGAKQRGWGGGERIVGERQGKEVNCVRERGEREPKKVELNLN